MRRLLTFGKLVASAAPSAALLPLILTVLLFSVNPGISPGPVDIVSVWGILALAYGPIVLVALPAAFTCVRFFAAHPLQIGWFHLKTSLWFLVTGVSACLAILAWNLSALSEILGARGRARLVAGGTIVAAGWIAAVVLAGTAQWRSGAARDLRLRLAFGILAGSGALSTSALLLSGPALASAPSTVPEVAAHGGPVVLLAVEGASLAEILPLASEGKLPNLARMIKEGSRGPLRTLRPCRSSAAWASLATGKLPSHHGIKDVNRYRLGTISEDLELLPQGLLLRRWLTPLGLRSRAAGEKDLRARPLWTILDLLRVEAVFLNWPLEAGGRPRGLDRESEDRAGRAKEWLGRIAGGAALTVEEERRLGDSVGTDLAVHDTILRILWSEARPRLLAGYLPGVGLVSATFPHGAHSEKPGAAPGERSEVSARITDRYYEMIDQMVGQIRSALPEGGYLMVVSPYGIEPLGAADRVSRWMAGLPAVEAGHDDGPAGVLMLAGAGVAPGKQIDDLRVTDVVPLTLYFLGLPVGYDMDGRLPRRLFSRAYLEAYPITFIPTYG